MRAGSTRPSQPRHHWMFQVISFTRSLPDCCCSSDHLATRILTGASMKRNLSVLVRLACVAVLAAPPAAAQRLPLERIKLPPGFEISVFAEDLPNARALAVGKGVVF